MTPEEIQARLNSPRFVGNIFAMAASPRPTTNPTHQAQWDAAKAIADQQQAMTEVEPEEMLAAYTRIGELLETYVLTYGQSPNCY